jgi:hypothetical protein
MFGLRLLARAHQEFASVQADKGLGLDEWVNASELPINAVSFEERKPLAALRFNQKVRGWMSCFSFTTHGHNALGVQAVPTSFVVATVELGKPDVFLRQLNISTDPDVRACGAMRAGKSLARAMNGQRVEDRGESKRRVVMIRIGQK